MKINSELERILRAQQQAGTAAQKSTDSSAAFDDVFQQALQQADATSIDKEKSPSLQELSSQGHFVQTAQADGKDAVKSMGSAPMGGAGKAGSDDDGDEDDEEEYNVLSLMSEIEDSLSGLDEYTKSLQNIRSGGDLKQAWQSLFAFSQSVDSLRQNYASLSQQDSSLDAMINDLEIMAVTETYKFNRGDYSL